MLVLINHREFTTESNKTRLSIIRFCIHNQKVPRTLAVRICMYLIAFLQKNLIIFAQRYTEDDRGYVLEAMDPLLSLASLAANIKHTTRHISLCGFPICGGSYCILSCPMVNLVSYMPVVLVRARRTSASMGM